jgi:7-cyano-7-deazaguanine synthase
MDSATCLALAARDCRRVHALTVIYGQRHRREVASARALARRYGAASHEVLRLPIGGLLDSSLTDRARPLPGRGAPRSPGIPSTYVPARNTILLALALGAAESRRADRIYVGVNAVDYSGYPDCRPEYIAAFQRLARRATKRGVEGHPVRLVAPLQQLSKAQIVRLGDRLGVPWELTWSCYAGGRRPCGACDACRLRAKGFEEAGRTDPLLLRRR